MANTHLQHPEDTILTGDLSVIDAMYSESFVSMKMDGCPAIVWGTNSKNGKFFVCTKSAFNKKKIKLCYTVDDINQHFGHQESVCEILTYCLKYLPRTEKVYQGDWLGFGRTDHVNPNTLIYIFPEKIYQKMIIAPHTVYTIEGEMWEAVAEPLKEHFEDSAIIKWVQPIVDRVNVDIDPPMVETRKVQFMTTSEASQAVLKINSMIRDGIPLTDSNLFDVLGCIYLTNLYQLVIEMKEQLMDSLIVHNAPDCYLPNGQMTFGEGFVMTNVYGMFKLVKREEFAHANMTMGRFAE